MNGSVCAWLLHFIIKVGSSIKYLIFLTIKPTTALFLKLYFYTRFFITPTCFDISWSPSGGLYNILVAYNIVYENKNFTSPWYKPLYKSMKLHLRHLMDHFNTATKNFVISADGLWTNFVISADGLWTNFVISADGLWTNFVISADGLWKNFVISADGLWTNFHVFCNTPLFLCIFFIAV